MKIKTKICGMAQAANIAAVADLQPDYLGFIFYAKSPRSVSEVTAELIKYVPTSIKTVGVFVDEELALVKQQVLKYNLKAVQLHGHETADYCAALKLDGTEVIKAFGVDESFDFSKLDNYLAAVDYFLFDTQTPAHGGSGKVFDWTLLDKYMFDRPYFLSGGIDLQHIAVLKKIDDPRFYAVDVNSRFELEPGLKNVEKLNAFMAEMAL